MSADAPTFPTGGVVTDESARIHADCVAPRLPVERSLGVVTVTVEIPRKRWARLIAEGQRLRKQFDRDSAGMRVLTAEDRARVSR